MRLMDVKKNAFGRQCWLVPDALPAVWLLEDRLRCFAQLRMAHTEHPAWSIAESIEKQPTRTLLALPTKRLATASKNGSHIGLTLQLAKHAHYRQAWSELSLKSQWSVKIQEGINRGNSGCTDGDVRLARVCSFGNDWLSSFKHCSLLFLFLKGAIWETLRRLNGKNLLNGSHRGIPWQSLSENLIHWTLKS